MNNNIIKLATILNQCIDIVGYSWLLLIMIKRVICKGLAFNRKSFSSFKKLLTSRHYISELILLIASIIAVCKFSNQLYYYLINYKGMTSMFARTYPWMLFHIFILISLIIKFWKSQPKLFIDLYEEITQKFKKK